jgi:N-acetylmuramoyl-L-alanine amidase
MVKFWIFCWFLGLSATIWAQTPTYLTAKPAAGDGTYIFLRRYGLERHACNFELFYELNGLTKNSNLQLSRTYKLPVEVLTYDRKSIRSTSNIEDWHVAKQVQRYNQRLQNLGIKSEDFRKGKRQLWLPHHAKTCPTNLLQFVPVGRDFPIFGKKYRDVPLESQKLAGAVYYIVAGHGGPDPGAMAKYNGKNICEDEYAYDISLRLARNLLMHGALVYLIIRDSSDGIRDTEYLACDKDEFCYPNPEIPLIQKERLTQRSDGINELYKQYYRQGVDYQCMIEIHVDSRSQNERIDLFFYHQPNDTLSQQLNQNLHQVFKEKYKIHRKSGEYHGDVIGRDLHMLRETMPISAFLEVANIQNLNDQKRILLPANRQTIADWLTEGLISDY